MSRPLPPILETDKASARQWLGAKIADRVIDQARRDCPVVIDLQKIETVTNDATAQKAAFIDGWNKALDQIYVVVESNVEPPPVQAYLGEDK